MQAERFSAKMNVATASSIEPFCSADILDSILDCLQVVDGDDPSATVLQASTPFFLALRLPQRVVYLQGLLCEEQIRDSSTSFRAVHAEDMVPDAYRRPA